MNVIMSRFFNFKTIREVVVELYGQYGQGNLEIVQHCMVYSKYEPGEM